MTRRKNQTVKTVSITPRQAKNWLTNHNSRNRSLNERLVNQIAEELTAGTYSVIGDTFCFDWNGDVFDGQHRLSAIVKSGIAIQDAIIVNGLDPSGITKKDTNNLNRSLKDNLEIGQIPNAKILSKIIPLTDVWSKGAPLSKNLINGLRKMSIDQYVEYCVDYGHSIIKIYNKVVDLVEGRPESTPLSNEYITAMWYVVKDKFKEIGEDSDFVEEFFTKFINGEGSKEACKTPWLLHRALKADKERKSDDRMSIKTKNLTVLKAILDYQAKQEYKKLYKQCKGDFKAVQTYELPEEVEEVEQEETTTLKAV